MYARAIEDFLTWARAKGLPFVKANVNQYKCEMEARGLAPSSVNQKLSAIRKLATEAADNAKLDPHIAAGIARVRGAKRHGVRLGNWLSKSQAEALLNLPEATTVKGKQDRALLSLLLGLAGITPFELYTLRHTCPARWAPHMDTYTFAKIAGHRDFATTKRYVHPQAETVKVAMERSRNAQGGHKSGHTASSGDVRLAPETPVIN